MSTEKVRSWLLSSSILARSASPPIKLGYSRGANMARIAGADPKRQGWLSGLFTRIVYGMTRRHLGHVVAPVEVTAHHSRILWGYGQMEQSLGSSSQVDAGLKHLAEMRVATLVGCPF
jgi:hypothetical protein